MTIDRYMGNAKLVARQRVDDLVVVNPVCVYCDGPNPDDSSTWYEHGALFINKVPIGLGISFTAAPELLGRDVAMSVQIQDKTSGNTLFDVSWSTRIEFEEQLSWSWWKVTPPEIAALTPGPYKYYGVAAEFESGAYSERLRLVFARRRPGT